MTQQDYNQEFLTRPEISLVTQRGIIRKTIISKSALNAIDAASYMRSANSGQSYHRAVNWAKPSPWAQRIAENSNFLSPVVKSAHTQHDLDQISDVVNDGDLKLGEVLQLGKEPLFAETQLYLDAMNADKEPGDMFEVSSDGGYLSPEAQMIKDAQNLVDGYYDRANNDLSDLTNDNFTLAA